MIGYWLTSSAIAFRAASLTSSGAAKSGNPCERLIASCSIASRVISRITDSVNETAFFEGRISLGHRTRSVHAREGEVASR